jgi:DNA-binding NarL/FixJ family response regulator
MSETPDQSGRDPWHGTRPKCRVYADSPRFRALLDEVVGDALTLLDNEPAGEREAVLVDCCHSSDALQAARERHPALPLVGVIAQPDAAGLIEVVARGADGVIALVDPPDTWRECLHVVLGGGRWLGGPGLEISLEQKYASYGVAKGSGRESDVTLRTQIFVKERSGEKNVR